MKRDALDAVFSDLIRESYDWTCQCCGLQFPERKGRNAQCSHFYKRKYNSTRWYPDNCVMLCGSCHDRYENAPAEHTAFIRKHLGDVRYEALRERWRGIFRYRKRDKDEMKAHYRAELGRLLEQRAQGAVGYLPVVAFD